MHNVHITQKIGNSGNHAVTAPVGYRGGDDVVRRDACGDAAAATANAGAFCTAGHIFVQMFNNRAHTELIAEVTDGDVQHARLL